MADPISVQCPHCNAKLKLKAAPPAGKKVGCPKCKKPFPVKAPPKKKAAEEDFLDALDDLAEDDYEAPEDEDSEEQEEERPARSTTRARSGATKKSVGKGKKGRSKKSSAGPLLAIIGGVAAAVLLLGGAVWMLMNLSGSNGISSASGEYIAFLPSDADFYVTARPADLIVSPVLASFIQLPDGQKGVAEIEKTLGFPPQEIEHLFLAVKMDPNAKAGPPGAPMGGNPMMGMPGMPAGMGMLGGNQPGLEDAVLVLRLKQPYGGKTLSQVTESLTAKTHNGINYYVDPKPNGSAMIFGDDKHAILTEPKWIERLIDRKAQAENQGLLDYLAKEQHLTVVVIPKEAAAQSPLPPGIMPNPEMQKLAQEIASVRLDVNLPGGIDLKVALTCKADSAAQQMHAETTKQIEQLKKQAGFLKMMLPEIDAVIASIQVSLTGPTMNLSASVPSTAIDRLKQLGGQSPTGGSPGGTLPPGLVPTDLPPGAFSPGAFPPGVSPPTAGGSDLENPLAATQAAVSRSKATNNLKQVLLGFHNYHDTYNSFPGAFTADAAGQPLLSWRVHILPFVGQKALYDQFHLNEPWDSEHNKTLIAQIPSVYASPDEPDLVSQGRTNIVVPTGPGMAFEGKDGLKIRDFLDGTSNTLMAVEVASSAAVIWTKPDDLVIDVKMPHRNLMGSRGDVFLSAFADGSARSIKLSIAAETLSALFTRNRGETIPPDAFP